MAIKSSFRAKREISFLTGLLLFLVATTVAFASVQQEVYVTGHVRSFEGYAFTEAVQFDIREPGKTEVGRIVVDGLYNGEYPWVMRIYTDNLHYSGIAGAVSRPLQGGLVSSDGKYVIPLQVHSPLFGTGLFRRIPDLNEPGYRPYEPALLPGEPLRHTDNIVMGIDPRNADWVASPDGVLFTADDNTLGDRTLRAPFELILQADVPSSAARGKYEAILYIEIVPSP